MTKEVEGMRGGTEKNLGLFIPIFLLLFLARPAGASMMDGGKDGDGEADIADVGVRKVGGTPPKTITTQTRQRCGPTARWWPARRTPPTSEYARENSAGRRSCGIRRGCLRGNTASGGKCP